MNFLGIIPARYQSSRFPGKPLTDIAGKTMIRRVYEQATKVLDDVLVATDDRRIEGEIKSFGGDAVMTSNTHRSGTDRCAAALETYQKQTGRQADVVINIQGDEPLIRPAQIREVMSCFDIPDTLIATLIHEITDDTEIYDPNITKVVTDRNGRVLYFSRSTIPYLRDYPESQWINHHTFFRHIGIYAYRTEILLKLTRLQPSSLEIAESLEQNRWLENGYSIVAKVSAFENHPVDTPGDLRKILHLLNGQTEDVNPG